MAGLPEEHLAAGCTVERSQDSVRHCDALGNVLLGYSTSCCQLPQHTFRVLVDSINGLGLLWQQKRGLQNIRQVVIVLCLISV